MGLERTGHRHLHRQFTEADHHQVHQKARHQIRQYRAHRPALVDGHPRAHEQPGANHTTERQHENVPALQGPGQVDTFTFS
ncbi:hypothetical protein D3C72_2202600 [compost metagenome]